VQASDALDLRAMDESEGMIRPGNAADISSLVQVFYDSVRHGAGPEYSDKQRAAWAPAPPDIDAWTKRLAEQLVLLDDRDGVIVGFMTMTDDGYIDLAFVAPTEIGTGVAKAIYTKLVAEAKTRGIASLYTQASARARKFFERQGWRVDEAQKPVIRGVELHNYKMSKQLDSTG
jgi:putative acetyltransferase